MGLEQEKAAAAAELGRKLKAARKEAGVTMEVIAQRIRADNHPELRLTTGKTVAAWFNRTPRVPFYAIDAVAHALGVPLATFSFYPDAARSAPAPLRGSDEGEDLSERLYVLQAAVEEIQGTQRELLRALEALRPPRAGGEQRRAGS